MVYAMAYQLYISIHAPREGSDEDDACHAVGAETFQSTLPVRGATTPDLCVCHSKAIFQSTLPVRGATSFQSRTAGRTENFNPRSP